MTDQTTTTAEPKANDLAITTDPATWTIASSGNSWLAKDPEGNTVAKAKTQRALRTTIAEWQIQWDAAHPAIVAPETETTTTEEIPAIVPDAIPVATEEETIPAIVAEENQDAHTDATEIASAIVPETTATEEIPATVPAPEETRATTLEEQEAELAAMVTTETVVNAKAINQARKGETAAEADARLKAYRAAKKYKHSMAWQLAIVADIPEGMTAAQLRACILAEIAKASPVDGAKLAIVAPAPSVPTTDAPTATEETAPAPIVALVPDAGSETTTEEIAAAAD